MSNESPLATLIESLPPLPQAALLARLIYFLGQAARGSYAAEPGTDSARSLRSYNEMVIVAADQLNGLMASGKAVRSGGDFVAAIEEWSEVGHCHEGLEWAISKALTGSNRD